MRIAYLLTTLTLTLAVSLTGCSSDRTPMMSSGSSRDAVGAVDVGFLQDMMPLNRQAVRMSEMAKGHSRSPRLRALADRMGSSRLNEIRAMKSCRTDWDEMGAVDLPMMQGSQMMPGTTAGMMSGSRMRGLSHLRNSRFDARFLAMMSAHHRAALADARTELDHGVNPRARGLAHMMEREQSAELETMHEMLKDMRSR